MNKPDAILCADLHIRDDQPICRTDNYFQAQEKKLKFLISTAAEYSCPIICAGDFFDKAKSSKWLEIYIMGLIKEYEVTIHTIPGNHDLPYHSLEKISESSLGILEAAGVIKILKVDLEKLFITNIYHNKIGIMHKLLFFENISPELADNYYEELEKYHLTLLLCGDNHQTFYMDHKENIIVNPGSMMRMKADQMDHKPCFFLYYADENKIEQVFFPIEQNVITREYIDKKEIEDNKMLAYIERVNKNYKTGFDFEKNLENYIKTNKIKKSTEEKIRRYIDE